MLGCSFLCFWAFFFVNLLKKCEERLFNFLEMMCKQAPPLTQLLLPSYPSLILLLLG